MLKSTDDIFTLERGNKNVRKITDAKSICENL